MNKNPLLFLFIGFLAFFLGSCNSPVDPTPPPTESGNAYLASIKLSDGLVLSNFDKTKETFDVAVDTQTQVMITAITEDGGAQILLGGTVAMTSGVAKAVLLGPGDTVVTLKVLAEDNKTSKTYTLNFKRSAGSDTALSALTLTPGTVDFTVGNNSIKGYVENATTQTKVTATPRDPKASVVMKFGGVVVTSATPLTLAEGDNPVTITVTAADGTTTGIHNLVINRAGSLSNNAYLTSLGLPANAVLSSPFVKTTFEYNVSFGPTDVSFQFAPITEHAGATKTINGKTVAPGANSETITIVDGQILPVVVKAQDGLTIKTYYLTVKKTPVIVSELSGLTVSQGTLTPSFNKSVTSYTVTVPYETTSMTVTPTALAGVEITVNGAVLASGTASPVITLPVGSTPVDIKTLAQGITTPYSIAVTRLPAVDPELSGLVPSAGTMETFAPGTLTYNLNIGSSVPSLTLTPTLKAGTQGTIWVNGVETASGSPSASLSTTMTSIPVVLKNLAGVTKATYTINLIKSTGLTIHFQKPAAWGTPQLYYYGTTPVVTYPSWATAPNMVAEGDPADALYCYTIQGVTSATVIFKDTSGNQIPAASQPGFLRSVEGWYVNGVWTDYNPIDKIPPVVNLLSPTAGANLTGNVTLSASATDNKVVTKVEFLLDGKAVASTTVSPYTLSWNSAYSTNGSHTLTAKAYDGVNSAETPGITVTTNNVNLPPVANAGKDIKAQVNTVVTFDGSQSSDPNGTIVSYSWDNGLTGVAPTKTYTAIGTYNVVLTVKDNDGATATDSVVVTIVEKLPHRDFREERVYFMMTDRFSDGNETNNNIWGDEYLPGGKTTMYDYDESKTGVLSYYHGGDFDGIIKNLDYLQEMGFTAIWITPVVKQPEGRRINNDNNYSASAFHGYWGHDFDSIDPHLTSLGKNSDGWADFDKLVDALHNRGMKLMLDIVVNHGQPGDSVKGSVSKWAADWNKIHMDGQVWTFDKASDPLVDPANPLTGFFSYPGTGGTWLIDLIDFNGNGPAANSAMPHLKNVYKRFIDHGVDAFRIDTAAYMSHANWKDFTDEMDSYAKSKGNDYFYMIGEAWTGDRGGSNNALDIIYGYTNKAEHFNMLDLHNSSMDFPGWLSGVFKGEKTFNDPMVEKIYGTLGDKSGVYDPTYLGTFVDNHDVYRANGVLTREQYMNNLNYIYLFRGVPIVYYGTEAMYAWTGAKASTNKEDVCARWMLGDVGINYVKTNKPLMYTHIKLLNKVRADFPVLQKGQQTNLTMSGEKAVIKRALGASVAYVAITNGPAYSYAQSGLEDGSYTLLIPNSATGTYTTQAVTVSGQTYTFNVPANSFAVLVK